MVKDYSYHVEEKSITQNTLIRVLWNPIVEKIPSSITPNSITVCGAIFVFISGFFVWFAVQGHPWAYLGTALFIFLYMTCDNIDGIHARRTGQSSQLGEFLDHWLDALAMVVINMGIIFSLEINDCFLLMVAISVTLSFFATIWEHYHTGVFYSGRLGTNEGLLLIICLYLFLFFVPKAHWVQYQNPTTLSIGSAIAYLTLISCTITTIKIIVRVGKKFLDYPPLLLTIVGILVLTTHGLDLYFAAGAILLSNAIFSGPFLIKRLTGKNSSLRRWIYSIVAVAIILWSYKEAPGFIPKVSSSMWLAIGSIGFALPIGWDLWRALAWRPKEESV